MKSIALKSIHTHNIQSHIDVHIELPETGIIAFTGNNSNGKSVITKVTNAVISNSITKPKERRTLVNKNCMWGSVTYERYDGMKLMVCIHHEAAQTFAVLTHPDGTEIRRYLADKTIPQLVKDFGFHYNTEHEISLNLHNDDDKLLFVDTKHTTNYACLNPTLTDEYSEQSLTRLEVTQQQVKDLIKTISVRLETVNELKANLQICDIEKETARRKKMLYIAKNLQHFTTDPCPKVQGVPSVVTMTIMPDPPKIKYPVIINLPKEFPDIVQLGRDLNDVLKGVCPTCKRAFFS